MSNSSTISEIDLVEPIHPREVLAEDCVRGFGVSQNKLAVSSGVPLRRNNEIVRGKRSITVGTAIRLVRSFGTSEDFRILQPDYELRPARRALWERPDAIASLRSS